jgi:excisionase family DNA binding protein
MEKRWLTMKEAVEYTGYCSKTLKKLALEGHIKGAKRRNRWRFEKNSIDEYLSSSEIDFKAELILQEVR